MPDWPRNDETQAPPDTGEPLWSGVSPPRPEPARERYQAVGELARGGIGRVIEAWDRELERPVALKELLRDTPANRARFRREILFTARLQHPAIVPLYDIVHLADGSERYAMKLVSGRTLDAAAAAAGSVEERLALLPHVLAVADALAYAHARGVIHRDVKPQNVLVGAFGETVLIDWGVAKDVRAEEADAGDGDEDPGLAALTHAGAIVGTPAYMAPEQARGEPADYRADVYALGATLYHVLSGSPPYAEETARTLEALLVGRPPEALEQRAPGVPDDLLSIVRRAMAPDRADRYPTAQELAADLHRFSTGQLVAARRYTPADLLRRWVAQHRALVGVVLAAALLLVVVGAGSAWRIVTERDAAEAARGVAQARADALVLVQARRAAATDPTEAAAWLAQYPADGADWDTVFRLVQEVASRGVAAVAVRHGPDACDSLVYAADGRTLYPGSLGLGPLDAATAMRRGDYGIAYADQVAALPGGGALALSAGGRVARVDADARGTPIGSIGASPTVVRVAGAVGLVGDRQGRVSVVDHDRIHSHPIGTSRVTGLAVQGARWVAATAEGTVWEGPIGEGAPRLLVHHPTDIEALVAAGPTVVFGDAAGRVYDLAAPDRPLLTLPSAITQLAASADGRYLAVAEGGATLQVLDRHEGSVLLPPWPPSRVLALAFAPEGDLLAATLQDGTLRLWRPTTDDVATRRAAPAMHAAVAFRPDGARFAACAVDGSMRVWPTPALAARRFRGHEDRVFHVRFLADGTVVSDSDDRTVRAWSPTHEPAVLRGHEDRVYGLEVAPDGRRVVTAGVDGRSEIWTPEDGTTVVLSPRGSRVHRAVWTPDGERVVTVGGDGRLTLWAATGEKLREVQAHQGMGWWAVIGGDGRYAWSAGADRAVRRWDLQTGELTTVLEGLGPPNAPTLRVHLVADGELLACEPGVGFAIVGAAGARRLAYPRTDGCVSVVVSPDGRTLASPEGPTLRLVDVATGASRDLLTLDEDIHAATFSPDGAYVATSVLDGTARVTRVADGASYIAHRGEGPVLAVAFSPDGRRLAASGVEPTVWVGEVDEDALLPPEPGALRERIQSLTTAKAPE